MRLKFLFGKLELVIVRIESRPVNHRSLPRRLQQPLRRLVLRIRQHLARVAFLHHFALGEDDDARGEVAGEVVVVRGDDERAAARP